MAYSDDLIEHANFLVDLNVPNDPKQVDLRRAVSAAYYALFHLLTSEAAGNWKHGRHQTRFARIFDHKPMKTCSSGVASRQPPANPAQLEVFAKLKLVAENFVTLQQARYDADYDNARVWSRTQAYEEIVKAEGQLPPGQVFERKRWRRTICMIYWIPAADDELRMRWRSKDRAGIQPPGNIHMSVGDPSTPFPQVTAVPLELVAGRDKVN